MSWLPTLIVDTPEEGFELALKISRMSVKAMQPSEEVREAIRTEYANDADGLIRASEVVALNFNTIAQANNYWWDQCS